MKYLRKIAFFFILIAAIFIIVPAFCFTVSKGFYFFADLFVSYETFLNNYFGEFSSFVIACITTFLSICAVIFTVGELFDAYFYPVKEIKLSDDSKS
jgi:hypothetical protein